MFVLVTGGSGSGKSAYAERRAVELFAKTAKRRIKSDSGLILSAPRLVYLATMWNDPDDPETAARIRRHRAMRRDKGFVTIEQPSHVNRADLHESDTALLEDLPNLLANEFYREGRQNAAQIADDLRGLSSICRNLVVVTGIIDCDGAEYDSFTQNYIRALSALSSSLAEQADEVTEVAAGIPVRLR